MKIFISAGEPSGDLHASNLAKALRGILPDIEISGIGSHQMKQAGILLYQDMKELAVVGIFDVLRKYPQFRKLFKLIVEKLKTDKPDCVVLVDYPGFNLRLAKAAKKLNIPVIYYISPQVWAWGGERIQTIKKLVDKMIVVFSFEEELYRKEGVDVTFVGHPLLEAAMPSMSKEHFLRDFGMEKDAMTIGLLPGSRQSEVKRILPVMLGASKIISEFFHEMVQFVILKSPILEDDLYQEAIKQSGVDVKVVEGFNYDLINACDFALVCSGTATLETAILQKPMIIVYRVSELSWSLFKGIVKIPNIGLANIVAGKRVVPELLQHQATAENIAAQALSILNDRSKLDNIRNELAKVGEKLGSRGASDRAARVIADFIQKRQR